MSEPNQEKEFLNEGMQCFKQGDLDRAEEIFRDFLREYPDSDLADNACYNLSKIAGKRGQTTRAVEWLQFLLKNFPESDAAYFAKDEIIEYQRELGIGPKETPDELYFEGKKALNRKPPDLEAAKRIFLQFLEKYPDSDLIDNAHYNLGFIAKERGDIEEARRRIEIIKTQYPDSDAAVYAHKLLDE